MLSNHFCKGSYKGYCKRYYTGYYKGYRKVVEVCISVAIGVARQIAWASDCDKTLPASKQANVVAFALISKE